MADTWSVNEGSMNQLDPTHIMQTATGFWASKVLLTAVEFDRLTIVRSRGR
jgi:hypothetical protein